LFAEEICLEYIFADLGEIRKNKCLKMNRYWSSAKINLNLMFGRKGL